MHPSDLDAGEVFRTKKIQGYFLGKPMPWKLMKKVMTLKDHAIEVYLGLWVLHSATRRRELKLKLEFFEGSGLHPMQIHRGLKRLVHEKFIDEVEERVRGKTPVFYLRKESEIEL